MCSTWLKKISQVILSGVSELSNAIIKWCEATSDGSKQGGKACSLKYPVLLKKIRTFLVPWDSFYKIIWNDFDAIFIAA